MSTVLPLLDNVIENLKMLTETVEVKYTNLANADETLEKTKSFDYYYLALNKLDTFETYPHYTEEALITSGVLDPVILKSCMENRNNIPTSIRRTVLENQRYIVIRDYVELNNYYRTYIGLPSTDDTEFFYVDETTSEELDIPTDVPIHKLDESDISKLQGVGFISRLVKQRPDKKYLKYLGKNKLDLYLLRTAKNLAIIQIEKGLVPDSLFSDFMIAYEQAREYFMVAVYIKEYASMHKYYDNIIGFMVMVTTIRRVMTNIFKNGIDRDFYDLTSILKMFDAYQIPFIPDYTLEQHRIVLRNINNLIRIKSTDRVLVDLVSLLGFTDVNIYKYYLVKSHKRDVHGNPVFKYKDTPLGQVLDYSAMYNINFSRVTLGEKNIGMAISNSKNKVDYTRVTDGDPFWWEDDDLKNAIYQNEFNYLETKYISFDIMYKMSKVVFETVYFLSMLHDRRDQTRTIEIFFNKIDQQKPINLFDICILLFALTAKKNGLKGEIIHDPTKVGYVLGFNFKKDLTPIIQQIKNDTELNDPELLKFIDNMSLTSVDDVNRLYANIRAFKYYITNKLFYCKNKELYSKYKIIYNTIMTTEYMGQLFKLPDGDIASTYKEYLMYTNYELYEFFESVPKESINEIELHIISKLQEYCESLKYMHQTTNGINTNAAALIMLVNFFKSYTVDIEQFNIIYIIDDRLDNLIKMISEFSLHSSNTIGSRDLEYDTMCYTTNVYGENETSLTFRAQYRAYMHIDDKFVIANVVEDKLKDINICIMLDSKLIPIAKINAMSIKSKIEHCLNIQDTYAIIANIVKHDCIVMSESLSKKTEIDNSEYLNTKTKETFNILIKDADYIEPYDNFRHTVTICNSEDLGMVEEGTYKLVHYFNDITLLNYDTYAVTANRSIESQLGLVDKLKIVYN